jgi:hypothetical protein
VIEVKKVYQKRVHKKQAVASLQLQRRCAQIYREVIAEQGFDPTTVVQITHQRLTKEGFSTSPLQIQKWATQFGWMRIFLTSLAIKSAPVDLKDVRTLEAGLELLAGLSLEMINVAKAHLTSFAPDTMQEVIDLSMAASALTKAAMEMRMSLIEFKPVLALTRSDIPAAVDIIEGTADEQQGEAPDLRGALAQFEKARKPNVEH